MIRQLLAILCIAWCLISNAGDTPDWLRQLDATL